MGVLQGEKAWKKLYRKPACMIIHFSRVWLFATLWTVANQAPLYMGFSRQENWSGLPCPESLGGLKQQNTVGKTAEVLYGLSRR